MPIIKLIPINTAPSLYAAEIKTEAKGNENKYNAQRICHLRMYVWQYYKDSAFMLKRFFSVIFAAGIFVRILSHISVCQLFGILFLKRHHFISYRIVVQSLDEE